MKEMQFMIEVHATREKVWHTMRDDETFREWAGLIDPGTYMVGELKEGGKVQFISAENGYGVTSLVERLVLNELLVLRHSADTQNGGEQIRENEWTDGAESYSLRENDGTTTLVATFDVPTEMEDYFDNAYPKAFKCVKEISER